MSRILVTGAAGFIGSHLVDALLTRGESVFGLDNFNEYYDPAVKRANLRRALENARFQLAETDICDEAGLRTAFAAARPDVVVHLAARAGVRPSLRDPNLYHRVNVIGTQHVLDLCREFEPSHAVMASSSSVYGGLTSVPFREDMDVSRPISPYAATKRMNELMGHVYHSVYGLRLTFLRFFTVYGPRQRPDMAIHKFARRIEAGEPISMYGDGSTERDYTYIDDIIDGVLRAVDKRFDYEIFNLGESETTTLRGLIALLEEHLGKKARVEAEPRQPGDVEITCANIAKARRLLGYTPKFTMDDGLAAFVRWFRASSGNQ